MVIPGGRYWSSSHVFGHTWSMGFEIAGSGETRLQKNSTDEHTHHFWL